MSYQDTNQRRLQELMSERSIDRRTLLKRTTGLAIAIPTLAGLLLACEMDDDVVPDDPVVDPDDDDVEDDEVVEEPEDDMEAVDDDDEDVEEPDDDRYGGTLNVATIGEPPTLDVHRTTAVTVQFNAWHIYEALFTWDADFAIMRELAEDYQVSDDGLTYTVHLHPGVNFHNGDVMTSEDVIASIERWGRVSGLAEGLMAAMDVMEPLDDHTIEFRMNEPFGTFTTMLARQNQGCAIYPRSVIEESTDEELAEPVGTGPFRFVEHVPDRHIHYERFEDYTDRPDPPSGYGGSKARYLDEMFFIPVPDEAARISGLRAGEYHYLESVSPDHFETLEGDDSVVVEILAPTNWSTFVINMAEGIMSDQTMRQAVQAALEHEEMALAGYGEGFFRLDPGLMFEETAWHSDVGAEHYSPADPDRAAELLEEAGYDGEPILLMSTQEYSEFYSNAVVGEQQLEDAGFNIENRVVDWATLVERRDDPSEWDLFTTFISFRVDPVQHAWVAGTSWPGWWATDTKVDLVRQLNEELDFDVRFAIWEELQELFYEEVPMIKIADAMILNARSPRLQNFEPLTQLSAVFYNVWLDD